MYQSLKIMAASRVGATVPVVALIGLCGFMLPHQPIDRMELGILVWWGVLCAVSVFNVLAWRISAETLQWQPDADIEAYRYQRRQLVLAALFTLGCAFRAIMPRADVQRMGLFDTWLSSILVGRSVATIAELAFVAQCALWLYRAGKDTKCRVAVILACVLLPLIVVAETFSWHAVLTTNYLGHVIEESLWTLSAVLVVTGCVMLWTRSNGVTRRYLATIIVCGLAYIYFMCTVDVPMYATRWLEDQATGREYLSLGQGLTDVGSRWFVTHSWEEWRPEMPWMTLYFSVGVWCSLALVHLPRHGAGRVESRDSCASVAR